MTDEEIKNLLEKHFPELDEIQIRRRIFNFKELKRFVAGYEKILCITDTIKFWTNLDFWLLLLDGVPCKILLIKPVVCDKCKDIFDLSQRLKTFESMRRLQFGIMRLAFRLGIKVATSNVIVVSDDLNKIRKLINNERPNIIVTARSYIPPSLLDVCQNKRFIYQRILYGEDAGWVISNRPDNPCRK